MAITSSMERQKSRVAREATKRQRQAPLAACCCLLFLAASWVVLQIASGAHAAAAAATASQLAPEAPTGGGGGSLSQTRQNYFGTFIGNLASAPASTRATGSRATGEVYAVDEQTLFIKNFNYDGLAPDTYFWSSVSQPRPSSQDGFIVPDEKGSTKPLERYASKDIVLRLPEGKTLREINWLAVWSRQLKASVGEILIPQRPDELVIPRPLEIAPFSQLAHGLKSGPITIVDAQTFLVPDFYYDGLGPDAYFWLTAGTSGLAAGPASLKLKDENGMSGPLRKYQGETIVVSLPDEFTIYDFDFFGVWCRKFSMNFGQVQLPREARVPPSPKMLGIKPENKLNCEILYDDLGFEIRWVLDGDDIVMQLVGKIEPGEYMAFGLGKDDSKSSMDQADAVVAWVDRPTGQVHATDYFLGSKAQCVNEPRTGSCPDVKLANGSDSLTLLHGAIVNGYSMVTFKRPQLGVDELYDQHVYSDGQQSVIWAVGVLNKLNEIGYHRLRTKSNMFIDFARNPQWNCPIPDLNASMHSSPTSGASSATVGNSLPITSASQVDQTVVSAAPSLDASAETNSEASAELELAPLSAAGNRQQTPGGATSAQLLQQQQAWFIPQVVCPNDRTFYAQIGPTAGKRGYAGLTGRSNWVPPVSWYINGLLVPELVVERGQAYRFIVEGGNDKTSASRRHPLYLTDSPEGGFNFKTDEERMRERIFGGVAMRASDGQFVPTAEGRLCEWKQTNATLADPDQYQTFSSYQRSLKLDCLPGQASILKFVPDSNTPDQIYYQCYTNRFMGWRIRVVNSCQAYISSQLSQLKQQQQLAAAAAASNLSPRRDVPAATRPKSGGARAQPRAARAKDTLNRRQSGTSVDLIDLKAQASEQRMLSFEPPPGFGGASSGQELEQSLNGDDFNLLNSGEGGGGGGGGLDFGDEFAASEDFQQTGPQHQSTVGDFGSAASASGTPSNANLLLLNNASLLQSAAGSRLNLSSIEQILKLSPSELEFLDDSQLDIVGAAALAAASDAGPQQYAAGQPPGGGPNFILPQAMPLTLQSYLAASQLAQAQAQQQAAAAANATNPAKATRGGRLLGDKMPKSLHSYMRRLASIYYPMQQQLASMLSLQQTPQQQTTNTNSAQQAQMLANLHQQIVASSTAVPPTINRPPMQQQQVKQGHSGEQATSASAPASSFSLASLVPKSKIDLSKSNLSKKLSKLRIKSGRKYEPQQNQQQASASNQSKQQARPPTPDNEFNYDIFNNQLVQLEKQQKQFQTIENFAAAMAAANLQGQWPGGPQQIPLKQQQQQQHYNQNLGQADSSFNYLTPPMVMQSSERGQATPSGDPEQSLMFATASPFESLHHQADPLQQQQQTLNFDILKNFEQQHGQGPRAGPDSQQVNSSRPDWQPDQQQQQLNHNQQAVFITKLPQHTISLAGQQTRDAGWQQQPAHMFPPTTPPRFAPEAGPQQTRPHPSYLDSTDYNSLRQEVSAQRPREQSADGQQQVGGAAPTEVLSSSDGTNHYLVRQQQQQQQAATASPGEQQQAASAGDLDHMLAIERYSKQSSERRPPSIVYPITGEQVFEQQQQPQVHHNHQHGHNGTMGGQPKRFSSKLIDKNIVEPTTTTTAQSTSTGGSDDFSSTLPPLNPGRHQVIHAEIMSAEQSVQAADLKRLNASELPPRLAYGTRQVVGGGSAQSVEAARQSADHQQAERLIDELLRTHATESAPQADQVRAPPSPAPQPSSPPTTTASSLEQFFAGPQQQQQHQQATATTPTSVARPPTSAPGASTSLPPGGFAPGPLVPSMGPPQMGGAPGERETGELVFKTNLIEPIKSTLVPSSHSSLSSGNHHHHQHLPGYYANSLASQFFAAGGGGGNFHNQQRQNQFALDTTPFTPIEVAPGRFDSGAAPSASNLLGTRLRPPPLIESMLSQWAAEGSRPEPPVRVASYLAAHLAGQHQGQPAAKQAGPPSQNHSAQVATNFEAAPSVGRPDLIILKPAALQQQQQQPIRTFGLRPQFLSTGAESAGESPNSLLYGNPATSELLQHESASRRLAGHQFDRLSSLSSPPSTSMVLTTDPMQASNSIQLGQHFQPLDSSSSSTSTGLFGAGSGRPDSQSTAEASKSFSRPEELPQRHSPSSGTPTGRQPAAKQQVVAPHRPTPAAQQSDTTKQQQARLAAPESTTRPSLATSPAAPQAGPGERTTGAHEFNILQRDNSTDNAILTHVMSLIASHAIPTPPLIPLASAYSSADYFLPISDQSAASQGPLLSNHLHTFRTRSLRS